MRVDEERLSAAFRACSFVAALAIVLIHTPQCLERGQVAYKVYSFFKDGLAHCAVPYFFFASGYYFSSRINQSGWYGRALRSRIRTLLIPFVSVAILQFVVGEFLFSLSTSLHGGVYSLGNRFSLAVLISVIGLDPFCMPRCAPLWFMRALMLIVLASPVLIWMVRRRMSYVVVWMFSLFQFSIFFTYWIGVCPDSRWASLFVYSLSFTGVCFFSLGGVCRHYGMRPLRMKTAWCCGILAVLSCFGAVLLENLTSLGRCVLNGLAIPLLIGAGISLAYHCQIPKWIGSLSRDAFPLYLTHGFVILFLVTSFKYFRIDALMMTTLGGVLFFWILATVLSLGMVPILRQFFPRVSATLFGGR